MLWSVISLLLFVGSGLAEQKIICYYIHGDGDVNNVDTQTCTHVHYSFVTLDEGSLLMRFQNGANDNGDLQKVMSLRSKNGNLRIIAAIGGGSDNGEKYSRMVSNPGSRTNFVKNAVTFLNQNNFDGLDFDWEYPACPQTNCDAAHKADKANFASLLWELRAAFNANKKYLSLSAAVNAGKWLTDNAYDYTTMGSALDYVNVMTYDNAGPWMTVTGHHAGFGWATQGVQFWASTGVPKSKILLGVPFYGISFSLKDPGQHGIGAPASSNGGTIMYKDICNNVKRNGWKKERPSDGPIAYNGNQWVGYDDPISAAAKAKWVRDNGFGGILVWQVDQDDINAQCCSTAKPMIKALGFGLFGKGPNPSSYGCE